jgi:cytochrome c6
LTGHFLKIIVLPYGQKYTKTSPHHFFYDIILPVSSSSYSCSAKDPMKMRKPFVAAILSAVSISLVLFLGSGNSAQAGGKSGESLFKEHCALCHPDGGNIVNPKKTLHKKDREASNIKSKDDIVNLMRKPGPGMTTFDVKSIPDKDAKEIAEYIIKTFGK